MIKILMLPLDERPCNYGYPSLMPAADYELILPPKEILGDKKKAGDVEKIRGWLLENAAAADYMVISLDTMLYGGIVPSRLHNETTEELIGRSETIEALREKNAKAKIYVFQLIMRCPDYSLDDEEPTYYASCGREIHLYGRYVHKEKAGVLTPEDAADFERVKSVLPKEYLDDYVRRREKNTAVLMHNLKYVRNGTVDYFIVPQDDAAPYGFTSMDQMKVREFIKSNTLHLKTAMYPSADDTGLILLSRAVADAHGFAPKIFVHYASSKAAGVVPWFEDRALDETIKYHILATGGIRVYSLPEADIALCVNMGSGMFDKGAGGYVTAYDVERNLAEFVRFIEYALGDGKTVGVADVTTCNGSDPELLRLLDCEGLLLKLHAYAGWNTSSNTIGTTVCQAVLYHIGRDEAGRVNFLLHRYYEDAGYMNYAREYITKNYLPQIGCNYFRADGKNGTAAKKTGEAIERYMRENYPSLAEKVAAVKTEMPWNRMFETNVKLELKKQS